MDGWMENCPPSVYQKCPGIGTAGKIHDANQGSHHQMIQIDSSGYQHQLQGHVPTEQAKLDVSPSDLPFVLPKKACNTVGALPITH